MYCNRRYEMVFEFTPTSDVLCESFWSFSIPSQGICVPFLLVGHVLEPCISLDRPAINFGQVR
jgi:hydrocephalus-inducing protein